MSEWFTAKLEDVADVLGGGTPSRPEASYFGGNILWATPTDVTALDRLYISQTKETITQSGLDNSSTKLMPVGAVLLTSRATIGYTAVATQPICTNQGFVNFVCKSCLMPEYLAYWLRTQKRKMLQYAGGTTFKEIARGTIRKFEISYPSLTEQQRIVDILSRAEGIVRLRREAQQKAAEIIPALFLDMFGDPATNPKGWPLLKVRDYVDKFEGGKNIQAGSEGVNRYRILKVSAVTSGTFKEAESKPAPDDYIPPANHIVREGDLLFSRANTEELVGATALVNKTDGSTLLPDKLWRFVWSRPMNSLYVYGLFQHPHVRLLLGKLSSGTSASMRNISQAKLYGLELPIAPYEQQVTFAAHCNGVLSLQAQQAEALKISKATFDALLSQSFAPPPAQQAAA